jgi:hypothetical protein
VLAVKRVDGVPTVFPADSGEVAPADNLLQVGAGWGILGSRASWEAGPGLQPDRPLHALLELLSSWPAERAGIYGSGPACCQRSWAAPLQKEPLPPEAVGLSVTGPAASALTLRMRCPAPPTTLQVVYDHGPVAGHCWDDFDAVRAKAAAEWASLPRAAPVLSESLQAKVRQQMALRGKAEA